MSDVEDETSEWARMDLRAERVQESLEEGDPRRYLDPDEPGATGPTAARSFRAAQALLTADEYEREATRTRAAAADCAFPESRAMIETRAAAAAGLAAYWAARALAL